MTFNGIDLFAGAGGLSEGFIQAGLNVISTVEKDKWACETQKTRNIFHYLQNCNQLDDYWAYCRTTLHTELIEPNRKKIYKKYPGLEEKINHTIWQAEFGVPMQKQGTSSSEEMIIRLEKSLAFHNVSELDFILGGPPCQAYSVIGRSRLRERVHNDERNFLFKFYYDIVKHFRPNFFLFENVPGIVSARNGEIFRIIREDFDKLGYAFTSGKNEGHISDNIQNALDFGVPQSRKRFIFLGIRNDIQLKYPDFEKLSKTPQNLFTKFLINDLPALQAGEGDDYELVKYPNLYQPLSDYQKEVRRNSEGIMNHCSRPLNCLHDREIYKEAIRLAEKGEQLDYSKLPEALKTHKNQKHFTDRFKVHWWNKIPHTIVAHIAKDGHYNIHPDEQQLRSLTVREAARIQSFPDNFRFEGPRTAQFVQVGNAVPPKMAKAFAEVLRKELEICHNTLPSKNC